MSFGGRAAAMVAHALGHLGDGLKVTLRRIATLRNRGTGKPLTALTVVSPITAGATTVTLTGLNLDGELPAGAQFQIAGNTYTTTNATEASQATNDQLVGVTFGPPLVVDAGAGAPVTVTQAYSDQVYSAFRASVAEGLTDRKVTGRQKRLRLVAAGSPAPRAPRHGDLLIDGSEQDAVTLLGPHRPGQTVQWVIEAGRGV